ncbi:unnamed protein product [Leptidea sinapis]|uniref:Cytochrome c oxidase polypeptide VIa n=1 Tax=Leptidea sinapis TaxID=189913 RepID=A0A5E4Q586_9NEOP|nr:unnamed protein product [Leptidea sinapis]
MRFVYSFTSNAFAVQNVRKYSLCCPPRGPRTPCGCSAPPPPRCGHEISPNPSCRPSRIPANPCRPVYHHGKDSWKKYRNITFFVAFPIIIVQMLIVSQHEPPHKGECRDYEYMRLRFKKFPWRDGVQTLFHNDHVNHVPGECTPPPLDCDE